MKRNSRLRWRNVEFDQTSLQADHQPLQADQILIQAIRRSVSVRRDLLTEKNGGDRSVKRKHNINTGYIKSSLHYEILGEISNVERK